MGRGDHLAIDRAALRRPLVDSCVLGVGGIGNAALPASSATAFSRVPLGIPEPGWLVATIQDAFAEVRVEQRFRGGAVTRRTRRLGPAGSKARWRVEAGAEIFLRIATVQAGVTTDPATGLVSAGTAAPSATFTWYPLDSPPAASDEIALLFGANGDLGVLAVGTPSATLLGAYAPGYARAFALLGPPAASTSVITILGAMQDPAGVAAPLAFYAETPGVPSGGGPWDPWWRLTANVATATWTGSLLWYTPGVGEGA